MINDPSILSPEVGASNCSPDCRLVCLAAWVAKHGVFLYAVRDPGVQNLVLWLPLPLVTWLRCTRRRVSDDWDSCFCGRNWGFWPWRRSWGIKWYWRQCRRVWLRLRSAWPAKMISMWFIWILKNGTSIGWRGTFFRPPKNQLALFF